MPLQLLLIPHYSISFLKLSNIIHHRLFGVKFVFYIYNMLTISWLIFRTSLLSPHNAPPFRPHQSFGRSYETIRLGSTSIRTLEHYPSFIIFIFYILFDSYIDTFIVLLLKIREGVVLRTSPTYIHSIPVPSKGTDILIILVSSTFCIHLHPHRDLDLHIDRTLQT